MPFWEDETIMINTPMARPVMFARDSLCHIVQDEGLCSHIFSYVLPPEEYYEELTAVLLKKFPKADPALVDHVVSLAAAFDTSAAFALSFGISKFQLAQPEVKLVGEMVGRLGRRPNPALVKAIKEWPEIHNLKMLQELSLIHI